MRYYAGFADKIHGNVIEISDQEKSAITRKEPVGFVTARVKGAGGH
jgi:acyl-CoA reductase-like NAD-dependent aldehyde dehydrogenase